MGKNLVIVESPAKAKTIEGFLGKDYTVKSCFGHVRDLSKKDLGVDIEHGFLPRYEISPEKKKVVSELKKNAKEAEVIWLASDEDREGEAIAWHLQETLNLDEKQTKRIVFHEITKNAILEAIEHPRKIDKNLVDAQQARRVLDRLVGFELSPLLWRKVKPSLSAGRVQSVAVRLIVEREEEIRGFNATSAYRIQGDFITGEEKVLTAELNKRFTKKEDAAAFIQKCLTARFTVADIETKPGKKSPAPPFTTSTLQQEASRKLGFSVANTMRVAQQLYESGKITYMRTDSTNLSKMALGMAKEEITTEFGPEYVHTRQYATKSRGAQEAHEAIRPTYPTQRTINGDNSQKRLYDLIWKRMIASQMSDALLEKTNITINVSDTAEKFIATGEVIKFDGFLKVYLESHDDEDEEAAEGILPMVKVNENLHYKEICAREKYSMHPPRYTEASLVKKLEELGIGRPSTYAPTISTIQKREYVMKDNREGIIRDIGLIILRNNKIKECVKKEKTGYEKGKLFPTDIGSLVNAFLFQYFENILDYNFTATVEEEFDQIAQGKTAWNKMIRDFYFPFHKQIEETQENSGKVSGEKHLGTDPSTGEKVIVRLGRFGPIVQIGESEGEKKPRYASLKKEQSIDTITLEEAMELFRLPRTIGEHEGAEMVVAVGRFGPYIRYKSAFYSLPKTDDPLSVTKERALEIIEEKQRKEIEKTIREFPEDADLKILNGRYGPYISYKKQNYKIPKGTDPVQISREAAMKIISETEPAKPFRKGRKKA
ncbi:MAG: type I DNA topoisomerase [Syntrophothermus sp.]